MTTDEPVAPWPPPRQHLTREQLVAAMRGFGKTDAVRVLVLPPDPWQHRAVLVEAVKARTMTVEEFARLMFNRGFRGRWLNPKTRRR